jgi:translation initiation factor 2 alpha subunit (eIF-2alpha)
MTKSILRGEKIPKDLLKQFGKLGKKSISVTKVKIRKTITILIFWFKMVMVLFKVLIKRKIRFSE